MRLEHTTDAHIRFSTQIIKRLGEELNPSIDQSILELVKNAYDADSRNCTVELNDITEPGGSLKITDDGTGMNEFTIINGWLVLGESSKSYEQRSELNRIPSGSKGLGRLAALRMGHAAILQSVPRNDLTSKYSLSIDWNAFDNARFVEDVLLPVVRHVSSNNLQGTTISIEGLKTKIGERDVRKIARGLILLANPFEDDSDGFKPVLRSAEFRAMEELVSRRYFDDADYHLVARIDSAGVASAEVLDYRGQVLFAASHSDLSIERGDNPYLCPPTTFDFWAFILNSTAFLSRQTSLGDVREWLKEFGGVHLYENGLRVNPYGNPGNDWLGINLARARSPEERPSTNTSIGIVRVNDSYGLLSQKTDRSGFIEGDVFYEIRQFCEDSLSWMARKRMEVAEQKRQRERENANRESVVTKDKVQLAISLVADLEQRGQLEANFESYDFALQAEVRSLKSEVQLYRTLSTAGITAATFAHETRGNSIKVITQSISAIERRTKIHMAKVYDQFIATPVSSIMASIKSLEVLGSATLRLLASEKRRITRVDIHSVIDHILVTFQPFLVGRDITVTKSYFPGNPYLRSTEAALESVVTNLINNSIVALEEVTEIERRIFISTEINENIATLIVSDNGPGIHGIGLRDIWLPGETTNPNGTGLGLTIVRDAISDMGGSVSALSNGEYGGAQFNIDIPIIGV